MKIVKIEPTPSPNSMKVVVDQALPARETYNYKKDQIDSAPPLIQSLLAIEGVRGLFHVADFMALDRRSNVSWEEILPQVREAFGETVTELEQEGNVELGEEAFGEVQVFVQFFRDIPMQIKLVEGDVEERVGLPERFGEAVMEAQDSSPNVVMERQWIDQGARYGQLVDIGQEVAEEIGAAYDNERLNRLIKFAFAENTGEVIRQPIITVEEVEQALLSDDWRDRFAALDKFDPKIEHVPTLVKALDDEKASIRRLATIYLGLFEDEAVLPYLYQALQDKSVSVRRTAGDCLSDLGSQKAIPAMIESLQDDSRIVRWRAAMFLYEVGDDSAIPALRDTENDPEFEVGLQAKMALKRIESGQKAAGSVWQQMTDSRKE